MNCPIEGSEGSIGDFFLGVGSVVVIVTIGIVVVRALHIYRYRSTQK